MLPLSIALVVGCALAYPANGLPLYGKPLSLLIDGPHGWCYHAILALLSAIAVLLARHVARERRWGEVAALVALTAMLGALQVITERVQPAHDALALLALSGLGLFSVTLALRRRCVVLTGLAALALLTVPVMGSSSLTAMGWAENLTIVIALVIVNCVHREVTLVPAHWLGAVIPPLNPGGTGVKAA